LFASGAIIYAYVNGNPVNAIDPLGLETTYGMFRTDNPFINFNPTGFGEGVYSNYGFNNPIFAMGAAIDAASAAYGGYGLSRAIGGYLCEGVAGSVHGNSLASLRPTWGYRLFSQDGTFLKNGITSETFPESRYTKGFMSDKYMSDTQLFPNRRAAYDWEFQQNQTLPGPLNKNLH
jgi:hypothetical protein